MNDKLGEIDTNSMMVDSNYVIKQFQSLSEKIKIRMNSKRPLKYIKLNRLDKSTDLQNAFITLQDILSTDFPQNKFEILYEHVFTPRMKGGEVIQNETISITIMWK